MKGVRRDHPTEDQHCKQVSAGVRRLTSAEGKTHRRGRRGRGSG